MENAFMSSTSSNSGSSMSLKNLKEFASFILNRSDEAVVEYLELLGKSKPALINLFTSKDKKEMEHFLKKDLEEFLNNILEERIEEKELTKIKEKEWPLIPYFNEKKGVGIETRERHGIIKKIFFNLIPLYTQDVEKALAVLRELENLYFNIEQQYTTFQINLNHKVLKREKDYSQSLINHSTDGIIAFDNDLFITEWNKVIEVFSGIKREFVLGKKIFDLFPGFEQSEEGQAIFRVLKGEKVFLSERAFANKSGFYEANLVPLFGLEEEIIGGFIVLHDITKNKLAELALYESKSDLQMLNQELIQQITELQYAQEEIRKNEKLLRKTQQLAHMGTWVWEVNENKIYWSKELCEIFEMEETLKVASIKSYLERVHPEDRGDFYKRIRMAVRSQQPFDYEHRVLFDDGSVRYIYMQGIPEKIRETLLITGFCQDISQKRKAIETIQSSENRFRTLCEESPDAIFLIEQHSILYCNHSAVKMLGASSKSQVLKLSTLDLSPTFQPDNTNSSEKLSQIIDQGITEENKRFEWVHKKLDGTPFWTEIIITPIQLEERPVLHVVWRDITHRKRIEGEVKQAKEELIRINNELEKRVAERTKALESTNKNLMRVNTDLDTFVYAASHDLRAPMSNIEGLINELIKNACYQNEEVKWYLDMIVLSVEKFKRTISDLSRVTEIQKSEEEDYEYLDVEEVLEDLKFSIQNIISSTNTAIITDFSSCKLIYFSRKNIRSVLYNIVSNAIKYKSPDRTPVIHISTYLLEDYIVLSIKDNGLGIKKNDREKVFSMFKRVHTHVEGSGVGLYLVKRIMENESGKIELESEENKGSVFKLFFKREENRA